jgi:tRNA(adenine34) deaminase
MTLVAGCQHPITGAKSDRLRANLVLSVDEERDEIYSLLAYSVVLKDWQSADPNQRGHNIGAVLVVSQGTLVYWARNCNHITKNGTQHAEVRLMLGYLSKVQTYNLKGCTVYTTLEPCAQCSGMMILQSVQRTVYGQTDPGFGKAIERLDLDSSALPNGFRPYPRPVNSDKSKSTICAELDDAYAKVGGSITGFLLSPKAKLIFEKAHQQLLTYKLLHPENEPILRNSVEFLNNRVTDHYEPINPKI